ncbi:hypothetical protein IHE45_03G084500 [Dioscorea alata]|uniref:Uncharacterized protein n=1 Tax=Dioscorea alata TaxID=55571 RepID=A0ACB7WM05_DIOAL|nr:hypothetical protein IHE45_03G084500 [Dioscorea alata]
MASSSSSSKSFLLFSVLSIAILVLIYSDVTHARNLTNASPAIKKNEGPSNYNNNKKKIDDYGGSYPQDPPTYGPPTYGDSVPFPSP